MSDLIAIHAYKYSAHSPMVSNIFKIIDKKQFFFFFWLTCITQKFDDGTIWSPTVSVYIEWIKKRGAPNSIRLCAKVQADANFHNPKKQFSSIKRWFFFLLFTHKIQTKILQYFSFVYHPNERFLFITIEMYLSNIYISISRTIDHNKLFVADPTLWLRVHTIKGCKRNLYYLIQNS